MWESPSFTEIKKLRMGLRKLSSENLGGSYRSVFRGQGQEFEKVREYIIGDDVRHIDWNVTARTGEPHLKVFREERNLTLQLVVDISKSQCFGSNQVTKSSIAAELAASLAWIATHSQDQIGLSVFSDHVEESLRPQRGKNHIAKVIQLLKKHQSNGRQTNLAVAIDHTMQLCKKHSLIFIISDFECSDYEQKLRHISQKHDVVCCHTYDPGEAGILPQGYLHMQDAEKETPFFWPAISHTPILKEAFTQNMQRTEQMIRQCGSDYLALSTTDSVMRKLTQFIHERGKVR
ncbi:MAG: DUF58 domain-containing protein [Zetaproteobacteria bacterium]|nr:DUF58 domain-containing protein [Zetaproteobacteria bacterium]